MRGLALSWLVALAACATEDRTHLMIEIDGELRVPEELDQIELVVVGLESGARLERVFELTSPLPHTFSLLPGPGGAESVLVTLTGRNGDAAAPETPTFVIRRVLATAFHQGQAVHLSLELPRACLGVECADGVDCVEGRCFTADTTDTPPPCASDMECDDGDPCTGRESCERGTCVRSAAADCDDEVACTVDSCEEGRCSQRPDDGRCVPGDVCDADTGCGGRVCTVDADCDDGRACNGAERCRAGVCATASPPSCDDGVPCTEDLCVDALGGCVHEPSDAACDDAVFCNGAEVCDAAAGCGPGSAVVCDDADECTMDRCDATEDACVHTTRDRDGDGHGDMACPERVVPADDCDDTSSVIHPGAADLCNGASDDCDAVVDEDCVTDCTETCADAYPVEAPGGRYYLELTTSTSLGSCGGAGAERAISFTLDRPMDFFATTHGTFDDSVLYLRACGCDGPEVACNDDADGLQTSVLSIPALPAGSYTLYLDSKTMLSVFPRVDIYFSEPGQPGHDCGRALPLGAAPVESNTCGGHNDDTETCDGSDFSAEDLVYYVVVRGTPHPVSFDTCTGCTRFDTSLQLRPVCTDRRPAQRLACADDGCRSSCGGGGSEQSRIERDIGAGLYYLVVDGNAPLDCGAFTLTTTGL